MKKFEFYGVGRVVFGRGEFARAGELAAGMGRSALLVWNGSENLAARLASLLKAAGIPKGSGTPNKEKVGKVTKNQVEEIAKTKLPDLNAGDLPAAVKIIEGTARSMGIEVV